MPRGAFSQKVLAEYENKHKLACRVQWWEAERQLKALGLYAGDLPDFDSEDEELDESGHIPEERPFLHVSEADRDRDDGMEYDVVFNRVAIRKEPSVDGRVLGMACRGEQLLLFDEDETEEWRSLHFRLRGGWGSLVVAWVMLKHPEFGPLLRSIADGPINVQVVCSCGKVFADDAIFCSACGARRPEPRSAEAEERQVSLPWRQRSQQSQPRGWLSTAQKARCGLGSSVVDGEAAPPQLQLLPPKEMPALEDASVAEGNLLHLSAMDLSVMLSQSVWNAGPVDADGCARVSSSELTNLLFEDHAEFSVNFDPYVAVRNAPSLSGAIVGTASWGAKVDTFGWDESMLWRKVFGKIGGEENCVGTGWILVRSRDHGELLRLMDTSVDLDAPTALPVFEQQD